MIGIALSTAVTATLLISAVTLSAKADTTQTRIAQASSAQACPPGTHWAEAGYVGGGKYREAHCANDNGQD